VTVVSVAVSDKSGVALFEEGPSSVMGHTWSNGKLRIETLGLDEFIYSGAALSPNYIKMDIEGAQIAALSSAEFTLSKSHPVLVLATHGFITHRDCFRLLKSLGYQLQPIHERHSEKSSEILATQGNYYLKWPIELGQQGHLMPLVDSQSPCSW
jgi:hypothetical protein